MLGCGHDSKNGGACAGPAAITFLAAGVSAQPRLRTALSPPVNQACISSSFGPRVLPSEPQAGSYHSGVDLPAAQGGLEMLVQHDGFVGVYSHFGMIMPERTVAAGERLGVVGMTGVTSGPHLYFEMILDGKPVDPAPYLNVALCNGAVRRAVPTPIIHAA